MSVQIETELAQASASLELKNTKGPILVLIETHGLGSTDEMWETLASKRFALSLPMNTEQRESLHL